MFIFPQINDTFSVVQEYSQLSKADDFNADMQKLRLLEFQNRNFFMPLSSESFLKSQRPVTSRYQRAPRWPVWEAWVSVRRHGQPQTRGGGGFKVLTRNRGPWR